MFDLRLDQAGSARCNSKTHPMGVTTITVDREEEGRVYTGCYDEVVRRWDVRNMRSQVQDLRVGGGVWRIRQRPAGRELLVAAMHDGFKLVDMTGEGVVGEYREHQSLAYGADWCHLESGRDIVASCSFYDHLMNIWNVNLDVSQD